MNAFCRREYTQLICGLRNYPEQSERRRKSQAGYCGKTDSACMCQLRVGSCWQQPLSSTILKDSGEGMLPLGRAVGNAPGHPLCIKRRDHQVEEIQDRWGRDEWPDGLAISLESRILTDGVKWNISCHISGQKMSQLSPISGLQMWMKLHWKDWC